MSTADGAILALGTVMSNNILRHLDSWIPELVAPENLLLMARISSLPLTIISTIIAAYYRGSEDHAAGATGSLLIIAFDIMLATAVVPLFGAFYAKNPSPRAALISIIGGGLTRLVLQFALKTDGSLILPYDDEAFLDYGPAASTKFPAFMDVNETEKWDPSVDQCIQEPYTDYTGVDSLSAFLVSILLFVLVQFLENMKGKPLFEFSGGTGYEKETKASKDNVQNWQLPTEVIFITMVRTCVSSTAFVCQHWQVSQHLLVLLQQGFIFLVFTVVIVLVKNALYF
jgi:hypothetical protein